jgi:hypothetical protein
MDPAFDFGPAAGARTRLAVGGVVAAAVVIGTVVLVAALV